MQSSSIFAIPDFMGRQPFMKLDDDFFIMDVNFRTGDGLSVDYPSCFSGLVCIYCISGEFSLMIGLDNYRLTADCFAISLPGDILRFKLVSERGKIRVLAVSDQLLLQTDFDMANAADVYNYRMIKVDRPTQLLIDNYKKLFRSISIIDGETSRNSIGFVLKSMNIELQKVWNRLSEPLIKALPKRGALADAFVAMVAKDHNAHHELQYYADRLNLTPKYLSSAIKKSTGKTAGEWIVSYVILEAKQYLRHSKLPVKNVAYELGFANQMDFYRYFLRHTGMTPREFRNIGN